MFVEVLCISSLVIADGIFWYNRRFKSYYPFKYIEAKNKSKFTFCVGYDEDSKPVIFDMSKSPNLLIGGITNSGKSV